MEREKLYDVISIENGWFRVMTELDEDYLFPPDIFEKVQTTTEKSRNRQTE